MRTRGSPKQVLLIAAGVTAACSWNFDPPRPPPNREWVLSGRGWATAWGYDIGLRAYIDGGVKGKATIRRLHTPAGRSVDIEEFVPPGGDTNHYCVSLKLPDSRGLNLLLYVRDTGDGLSTFDEVVMLTGPGARCASSLSPDDKQFTPLDGGDYEAYGSEHPRSAAAFPYTPRQKTSTLGVDLIDRPCLKCGPKLHWLLSFPPIDDFAFLYLSVVDPEHGLRARLFDTFDTGQCGGDSKEPVWKWKRTARAAGDTVAILDHEQEVPIVVYPLRKTRRSDWCEHLKRDWIYRGKGAARVTDDNVWWDHGSGGRNTYGIVIRGTVEDSAGNKYTVTGGNRYVLDGLCCFTGRDFAKSNFFRAPRNFVEGRPRYVPPEDEDWELVSAEETIVLRRIETGND